MDENKFFSKLPAFTIAGVPLTDRRNRWNTWKRVFEICLRATKVKDGTEKNDMLLACGSFELQDIFFNIPGADVAANEKEGIDPYVVAIGKLHDYFAPQRHEAHERFLFWAMKPEPEETLEKFLIRAQAHGSKSNFGKSASESAGIAIVDKMLQFMPNQLRAKLLQEKDLTLEEVIKQVNLFETSRVASDQMAGQSSPLQANRPADNIQYVATPCRFCARLHGKQLRPARDKTCANCQKRGHYAAACYSSPGQVSSSKPFSSQISGPIAKRKVTQFTRKVHAIEDQSEEEQVELVEMVSSGNDSDELIWAKVGGVLIEMQIDSGVQSNIIDDRTWDSMNRNGIDVIGEIRGSDQR
ncbi:uncharacterized protein LOC129718037 isoform X2 [Wyeomyia smithii]|uniref:uncharacterized protein LOC129718037 isoform X2 n=1 Tax=Wyeomyia smithii TaxID=174621 RepID=UPI002467E67B|nr:uncharacterized protein LOC129718037 isoform X2 [Wyeomyia smithii]